MLKLSAGQQVSGMRLIPVTNRVAEQLSVSDAGPTFADGIGDASPVGTIVGVGDMLDVTIWEAPPALLFGSGGLDTRIGATIQTSRPEALPSAMVGPGGTITVPFAGQVPASGRSLRQIEQSIVGRLNGKAHMPQAVVRIARNATANVSMVGEFTTAGRVPLTPRGERLLDVIAQAGGTRQAIDRVTIQVTRGSRTVTMPMQAVVRDARNNIVLRRDDIITALYQPNSFTVLGAAGKNEEVRFEGVGLSLSQALGRVGGLQDMRADPKGIFVFRWETPERLRGLVDPAAPLTAAPMTSAAFPASVATSDVAALTGDERIPVIFQVDLKTPETFFAAQKFAMRDGDVVFISNSPAADFQRFVNLLASSVLPALSVTNTLRQ